MIRPTLECDSSYILLSMHSNLNDAPIYLLLYTLHVSSSFNPVLKTMSSHRMFSSRRTRSPLKSSPRPSPPRSPKPDASTLTLDTHWGFLRYKPMMKLIQDVGVWKNEHIKEIDVSRDGAAPSPCLARLPAHRSIPCSLACSFPTRAIASVIITAIATRSSITPPGRECESNLLV